MDKPILYRRIVFVLLAVLLLAAFQPLQELGMNLNNDSAAANFEAGNMAQIPTETPTPGPGTGEEEEHLEEVGVQLIAEGMTAPTHLSYAPGDTEARLFVTDQIGLIHIVSEQGGVLGTFLDIRDRVIELNPEYDERGLLGLAFHPDYANNGRFFVYYSAPEARTGITLEDPFTFVNRLSEFRVMEGDPNAADPASERILLEIPKPQTNHNGGDISFGPDGMLYIPLGDGGGAYDTGAGHVEDWYRANDGGNGQDVSQNLLGSILRIDVDNGDPYAIPADNPVVGDNDSPNEQWAYGFRNPWRATWDMETGEYYVSDAGQELWEEVSIVQGGGNYGWNVWEGGHCFDAAEAQFPPAVCPMRDAWGNQIHPPIIEFPNQAQSPGGYGLVVVGGFVYRGSALPELEGKYLFGAWTTQDEEPRGGVLVAERREENGAIELREHHMISNPAGNPWPLRALELRSSTGEWQEFIYSFGQDAEGELYILTSQTHGPTGDTGKVWKIVPADQIPPAPEEPMPTPTPSGQGQPIYVSAENFYFEMPRELPAGTYTFIITNPTENTEHSFEIASGRGIYFLGEGEEWFLASPLDPGESAALTVDLQPGEYEIYCPVTNHEHIGMRLTLTVTE